MLDVDRLADVMLAGTKAMLAKELAPLRAENDALRSENAALLKRLDALEAREIPEMPDFGAMIDEAIKTEVSALIKAIPAPKDGKDGINGRDGRDGANGKDGEPGKDGKDGLGFDDMEVDYDGERGVVLRFARGDLVKEFALRLPIPIDRGVWKAETEYERGDSVTWAGSVWIAQKDAPAGKPEQTPDWRLSVKRGRDGKPAVKP